MLEQKSWEEFRETGLVLFINSFLHIFGWVICFEVEKNKAIKVYPARTKFRGFSNESIDKAYKKLNLYMKNHSEEIYNDLVEGDNYK